MSPAARATRDPPDSGAGGGPGTRGGRAAPIDRVVALFSGAGPSHDATAEPAAGEDWTESLAAVRGVAARMRALQKAAQDAGREAQRSVREADAARRAAEDRARHAEETLRATVARAERAEAQARAAAERAERAEAQTAEARAWLRRMHECMVSEFGGLTQDATQS
jgi:hypothetical protein